MRILLVKLNHIGDTLLMTPTIRWLRGQYPDAEIDVVVRKGCEGVLADNPDISAVRVVARPEKRARTWRDAVGNARVMLGLLFARRYDYAFDLSGSDRAKWLVLVSRARFRGINGWHAELGPWRRLFNRVSDFAWGREHQVLRDFRTVTDAFGVEAEAGPLVLTSPVSRADLAELVPGLDPARPYAVLHAASRWAFKEWVPQRWRDFAAWLAGSGVQVVLTGGRDEREREVAAALVDPPIDGLFNAVGTLDLAQVTALLRDARLYAGIDTAVMHMAAATQTPCLVLFGPSSEWSWAPWQCPQQLVLGPCNCKQTRKFVCDKSRIYPCMEAISLDQVKAAATRLLPDLLHA